MALEKVKKKDILIISKLFRIEHIHIYTALMKLWK